jgi:hypothetical protein
MKRILCLETEWGINSAKRLNDNASVRPMFEFIESLGVSVTHKTVATFQELRYYLSQMPKSMYSDYDIVYLAFHGEKGQIQLYEAKEKNTVVRMVSLEELSEMCSLGWLTDKVVMFGTCRTLAASESRVRDFMQKSGAALVAGYRKKVDFTHSSILDIGFITEIISPKPKYKSLKDRMSIRYSGLMDELGMIIYE